nr:nucleotide-binding alpha-beta plait domain-containing protein [Tanacetum cinerariifolium]
MSYVNVVNGDTKSTEACEPALLLDESCLNQLDYSLGLFGKVKEFNSFDNMRMVLWNEGFNDIYLRYMGGMWIMIGFKTEDTKVKFLSCLGATSWFSQVIQVSKEFVIDERITWVDIEGIHLKLWSESTFNMIAAKWGKILYLEKLDEGCLYSKSDAEKEGDNNVSMVPDSRNVEEKTDKSNGTVSIPFPPGFTPCDEREVECDKKSMGINEGSGFGNEKGNRFLLGQGKATR